MTEATSTTEYLIRLNQNGYDFDAFEKYLTESRLSMNTVKHYINGAKKTLRKITELRGFIPVGEITGSDIFMAKMSLADELTSVNLRNTIRGCCRFILFQTGNDFFPEIYGTSSAYREVKGEFGTFGLRQDTDMYSLYKPDVERFLAYLADKLSPPTIESHAKGIRHALQTLIVKLGYIPVSKITLEDLQKLRGFISENISPHHTDSYMRWTCRFILFCTGKDFFKDLRGNSCGFYWYAGKKGAFLFRSELTEYHSFLLKDGMKPRSADNCCRRVKLMCEVLNKGLDIRSLNQIDQKAIGWMEEQMSEIDGEYCSMSTFMLGRFVEHFTGMNPKKLFDDRKIYRGHFDIDSPQGIDFLEHLMDYREWMTKRNMRPGTVNGYHWQAVRFYGKIWKVFGPTYMKDVGEENIYRIAPMEWGISKNTLKEEVFAFAGLQYFACGRDCAYDAQYVWEHADKKRVFIHDNEYDLLWDNADEMERVVLALGSTLGIRRGEMADLKVSDFNDGMVHIRGKGRGACGKVADLVISETLKEALADYLPVRQNILDANGDRSDGKLFIRTLHNAGKPMSANYIGCKVNELAIKAGVKANTHSLRRYYCNMLKTGGMDIEDIRISMRHARADTTRECYIESDPETRRMGVNIADRHIRARRSHHA